MRLLQFTQVEDSSPVWIDVDRISYVTEDDKGTSQIHLERGTLFNVYTSPYELMDYINRKDTQDDPPIR